MSDRKCVNCRHNKRIPKKTYVWIKHNGISVLVQKWGSHKRPVLAVKIEPENCVYNVASFNSEETAQWFCEIMEEFFKGMVSK